MHIKFIDVIKVLFGISILIIIIITTTSPLLHHSQFVDVRNWIRRGARNSRYNSASSSNNYEFIR